MGFETIVVAFDNAARATAAIRAVRQMGVPARDIRRHPADADTVNDVAAAVTEGSGSGFWAWLFGEDTQERQIRLYQAALSRGGTVLSVRVIEEEVAHVRSVIASHGPLDLKDTSSGS